MSGCGNASVGVVITDGAGRLVMVTRAGLPAGIAPPAGHVFDAHTGYRDAAVAEVGEEVGLSVTSLTDTGVGGWRANRCGRSEPGRWGWGHQWRVYRAGVTGSLRPCPGETRGAAWYTPEQVQALAGRTVAYARGQVPEHDWVLRPGIEPVWMAWLADLGHLTATEADLALVDQLTRPAPTRPWIIDFAWQRDASGQTGRQRLYVDLTGTERTALVGLLAETTDPDAVVTLPVGQTPDGPRRGKVLRIVRIVGLHPYDDELGGER